MMTSDAGQSRSAPQYLIKDARGRCITMLDPIALQTLHRHEIIPAEPLHEITREIGLGIGRRRLYAGYVCWVLGILGCIAVVVLKFVIGFRIFSIVGLAAFANAVVIALGVFFTWRGARRARFERVLGVLLEHRRCPHCGYDIRGLPTAPSDRATVCPECGGAWLLPDASAAHDSA